MKTEIEKVRKVLANDEAAESIGAAAGEMQKASLKLFEMAYKKVSKSNLVFVIMISQKMCVLCVIIIDG